MEELRVQLTEIINNSELPAECIFYVFKDVFRDLQEQYISILNQKALAKMHTEVEDTFPQPQDIKEVNE